MAFCVRRSGYRACRVLTHILTLVTALEVKQLTDSVNNIATLARH
jgi:hypothetical protein